MLDLKGRELAELESERERKRGREKR